MTQTERAELRELLAKATPGPWCWVVTTAQHNIGIETANGWDRVMGFVRYGMNSAAPEFQVDGIMTRVDKLTKSIPGREHHRGFDDYIDHPDATLLMVARNALPRILDELDSKDQEIERLNAQCDAVQAERDAAVMSLADSVNPCEHCHYAIDGEAVLCDDCDGESEGRCEGCERDGGKCDSCFHGGRYECRVENNFKWRGPAKEGTYDT